MLKPVCLLDVVLIPPANQIHSVDSDWLGDDSAKYAEFPQLNKVLRCSGVLFGFP